MESADNGRKYWKDSGFPHEMGIKFYYARDGVCELGLKVEDRHRNYFGIIHGGVLYSIMDSAAGIGAATTGDLCVTVQGNCDCIRSATGGMLRCRAECIKNGDSLVRMSTRVLNENDEEVARGYYLMFKIKNGSEALKKRLPDYSEEE